MWSAYSCRWWVNQEIGSWHSIPWHSTIATGAEPSTILGTMADAAEKQCFLDDRGWGAEMLLLHMMVVVITSSIISITNTITTIIINQQHQRHHAFPCLYHRTCRHLQSFFIIQVDISIMPAPWLAARWGEQPHILGWNRRQKTCSVFKHFPFGVVYRPASHVRWWLTTTGCRRLKMHLCGEKMPFLLSC